MCRITYKLYQRFNFLGAKSFKLCGEKEWGFSSLLEQLDTLQPMFLSLYRDLVLKPSSPSVSAKLFKFTTYVLLPRPFSSFFFLFRLGLIYLFILNLQCAKLSLVLVGKQFVDWLFFTNFSSLILEFFLNFELVLIQLELKNHGPWVRGSWSEKRT